MWKSQFDFVHKFECHYTQTWVWGKVQMIFNELLNLIMVLFLSKANTKVHKKPR